jgi:hypothetical protein
MTEEWQRKSLGQAARAERDELAGAKHDGASGKASKESLGGAEIAERLRWRKQMKGLNPAGASRRFPAGEERGEAENTRGEADGTAGEILQRQVRACRDACPKASDDPTLGRWSFGAPGGIAHASMELAPSLIDSVRIPPASHEKTIPTRPGPGTSRDIKADPPTNSDSRPLTETTNQRSREPDMPQVRSEIPFPNC